MESKLTKVLELFAKQYEPMHNWFTGQDRCFPPFNAALAQQAEAHG